MGSVSVLTWLIYIRKIGKSKSADRQFQNQFLVCFVESSHRGWCGWNQRQSSCRAELWKNEQSLLLLSSTHSPVREGKHSLDASSRTQPGHNENQTVNVCLLQPSALLLPSSLELDLLLATLWFRDLASGALGRNPLELVYLFICLFVCMFI